MEADDEFMKMLYGELESGEADTGVGVDMLLDLASNGDYPAVADVLARFVDEDHVGWAAVICWQVMKTVGTQQSGQQNYNELAKLLGHLVDEEKSTAAAEICREMFLRYNGTTSGGYMQLAFLFIAMVGCGHQEWPAHILQHILQGGDAEDVPATPLEVATQSLGQMVQLGYAFWASHVASYLMVTHTDASGAEKTDYKMLASILANMTSTGYRDLAAQICEWLPEICSPEASAGESWFELQELMKAVGDFDKTAPQLISEKTASPAGLPDTQEEGDGVTASFQQLAI